MTEENLAKFELLDIASKMSEIIELHDPNNAILELYENWHKLRYEKYVRPNG